MLPPTGSALGAPALPLGVALTAAGSGVPVGALAAPPELQAAARTAAPMIELVKPVRRQARVCIRLPRGLGALLPQHRHPCVIDEGEISTSLALPRNREGA